MPVAALATADVTRRSKAGEAPRYTLPVEQRVEYGWRWGPHRDTDLVFHHRSVDQKEGTKE
jgi:hypothetical protein